MDVYGFPLVGLTDAEQRARGASQERVERMANKYAGVPSLAWTPAHGETSAKKRLKELVRHGIPVSLRPTLWLTFSGGLERKQQQPAGYYYSLVSLSEDVKAARLQVESEVQRSFPTHTKLSSLVSLDTLSRIVLAYSVYNPAVGFSHNITSIAAFVLAVMGFDKEEDVFWTMVGLTEDRLYSNYFTGLKGCRVEENVFQELLLKRCPKLIASCTALDINIMSLTDEWFRCLFVTALPAETTARVWDCLILEGPKVLFRVALALCKMYEGPLATSHYGLQIPRVLKWRAARTYDPDALLKVAFRGIGTLSMTSIKRTRESQVSRIEGQLELQRRRLQLLVKPVNRNNAGSPAARHSPTTPLTPIIEVERDADGYASSE